jgi:hypothetical protein
MRADDAPEIDSKKNSAWPMVKQKKIRVIITAGIALLAMLMLSAALSQTIFQPGEAINLPVSGSLGGQYAALFNGNIFLFFLYLINLISIAALLIITIYMLLTPERRKQLIKFLSRAVPVIVVLLLVANYAHACSNQTITLNQPVLALKPTSGGTQPPTAVFTPETSTWIMIAAIFVLAVIIASLVVFLILRLRRENTRQTTPLMRLADQAQAALDTVQAGGNLKNAVLRCYYEMSRSLSEQRNLKRDRSMTPHEFETMLVSNGMPGESVQLLTRLFEEVRYGTKVPGQREEWMAMTSLTAIIEACRRSP